MEVGAWGVCFIVLTLAPLLLCDSPCSEVAETEYHHLHHDSTGDDAYKDMLEVMLEYRSGRLSSTGTPTSINTTCTNVTFENGPLDMDMSKKRGCYSCQRTLTITSSEIPSLPAYAFSEFHETTDLYITNVKLENISQGAFNVLHSIRGLYLSDNNLVTISDGEFNSLRTLKILDLSRNNISSISTNSFARTNLIALNLASNSLETFNSDILSQVTKIDDLNLSFNNLTSFNFVYMDKVNDLNLSNNRISDVEGCFIELTTLDLSKNELDSLENLNCFNTSRSSKMFELDLSYNRISNLNPGLFSTMIGLENLELHHNNISSIPNGCFSKLGTLYYLNLSSNNLVEFQYGLFDNLRYLTTLDISYNKIATLKRYVYHSLESLRYLYIQHNKIYSLNSEDLARFLPKLLRLDLDSNNFTCHGLIEIFHNLNIAVVKGTFFTNYNIHGIQCFEGEFDSNESENFKTPQLMRNHEKYSIMDYIEKEGASSLIGYLKKIDNVKYNNLHNNYVDSNFKNTSFYKYLETLTDQLKSYRENNENITNYFDRDFKSSNFVKYLDNVKKTDDLLNTNFSQSVMYKYFNNDFTHSSFYKYLESLRTSERLIVNGSGNIGKPEELVGGFHREINLDSNILVAITVLLIFIACILVVFLFVLYIKLTRSYRKDVKVTETDEVELLGS